MSEESSQSKSHFGFVLNFLRRGLFDTIYTKGLSEDGSRPGSPRGRSGDFGTVYATEKPAATLTGDRGKSGAGLTGSRGGRSGLGEGNLPRGARNPGLLRYIHNAARFRLPQCFEGGSLNVKQSRGNYILGHTISFSSVSPGGYKLLLSYQDQNKPTIPPYFVLEAAPGGQFSCEVRVGPTSATRATVVAQVSQRELLSLESIFDAYFNSTTASVIAVNREFMAVHILQAVTDNVSLGAEFVSRGRKDITSVTGAARWANRTNALSFTCGNRGIDICYALNVKPFLTVAAMVEMGFATRRALGTLAYEWRSDQWTARGSLDSDGLVGATIQRALGGENAQLTCGLSALLNHPNDKFRLGFSMNAAIV